MNITQRPKLALIAGLIAATIPAAHATDAIFTDTYLAETLPKGAREVEQTITQNSDKSQGTYRLWKTRTEFEYGITDHWTVALYANAYSVTAESNNSTASRNNYTAIGDGDEVTGGGPVTFGSHVPFLEKLPLPSSRYHKSDFESISVESIYQLLSPYKDSFGLAAYTELTHGTNTTELELKALFQKHLLDDQLVLAGNIGVELEREKWSEILTEKETKLQLSGGASWRFNDGWRGGLEARNERGYRNHSLSSKNRDYSAWFFGPNVHFAAEKFFVTLSYLQQMPWASSYSPAADVELVDGRVYKNTEKHQVSLKVGYSF